MQLKERLYLIEDRSKAVKESDRSGCHLLGKKGGTITEEEAEFYGVVDGLLKEGTSVAELTVAVKKKPKTKKEARAEAKAKAKAEAEAKAKAKAEAEAKAKAKAEAEAKAKAKAEAEAPPAENTAGQTKSTVGQIVPPETKRI